MSTTVRGSRNYSSSCAWAGTEILRSPRSQTDNTDVAGQDIGDTEAITRLVRETVEQLGGLDIIVNNAGWTRFAKFEDLNALSHDEWNKVRLPPPCQDTLPKAN